MHNCIDTFISTGLALVIAATKIATLVVAPGAVGVLAAAAKIGEVAETISDFHEIT